MAEALAARGHDVTLLCVCRERTLKTRWSRAADVLVGETPNLRPEFGATGYGLPDILARLVTAWTGQYDLIHLFDHKPNATLPGFLTRLRRGPALISDWADWWGGAPGALNDRPHRFPIVHRFEDWWEVRSKLWSDGVTTISRVLRERALAAGCPAERVLYVPTGAPLQRIVPVPKAEARARLGLDPQASILGFVGISQDDLEILFATLQQQPQALLLLIGPIIPSVMEMAESLGVRQRVLTPGRIHGAELNQYLGSTDLLCLPMKDNAYNRGRLPNKLLDYLAAGRAVVACPVGDVADILGPSGAGRLAGQAEFSEAVASLLARPDLAQELGVQARALAETAFNWNDLVPAIEDFYFKTLDARGRSL